MGIFKKIYQLLFLPLNLFKLWLFKVKHGKITIFGPLLIINRGRMTIGDHARINSGKYKNPIGGDTRSSIVVKPGALLTIGTNLRMSNSAIYCAQSITLGNNVMIGGSCKIWDSDFHPIDPDVRLATPNDNYRTAAIHIGNNVFIGGASIILKGVTIGDNSVVGAGSVVSGNIPPNEIWAGNPARFIKKLKKDEQQPV
ncbi:MAG: acyltransferase [Niastella sp.]|jgi:acetyltransferase-like isoleucine patch superfamily enzyme|nr:acyltransferase [Niastella sp.]